MDVNTANQSTTDEQMMDILLVLDKEKKTISAVKGVDENGELQTVPPEDNSELLKFDRHGDFFSNFFSNSSCDFPSYLSFPHGLLEMKRGYSSCPVIFYIQKVNAQS